MSDERRCRECRAPDANLSERLNYFCSPKCADRFFQHDTVRALRARIAELELELADTRKAHEILEASAVADLEKLARAAVEEARSRADLWKEAALGRSGIEAAYEAGRAAGKAEAGELDDPRAPCDTSGLNDG